MFRSLLLVMALAATPAFAIDLEKWATDLANREMERWQKEKLETAIKGRDPAARLKAVEGLSHHDADSLAAFAIALGDSDARVRRAAANKLWSAEKKAEPYRVPLTRALDDTDSNVVAYAAGALQASGVKEADLTAPRQRVFESSDASVTSRFLVSRNLIGHQPPAKIAAAMIAYLERNSESQTGRAGDTNRENVALAERGLERLLRTSNDRGLIQPLREALVETKNAHIPLMKTLALFEPKPEGWTQTLLKQLENTAPRVRHAALGHLRAVKEEAEVVVWAPRAAAMLQDPDAPVRAEALWALESARGAAAGEIERVAAALTDPNPLVRRNAARALGEIGEATQAIPAATQARLAATARPALDLALQDGDRDVREEAKSALTKIAGRAGERGVRAPVLASAPNESSGMATLRARKVTFEESSFFTALRTIDLELVGAFLDAGMSPSASLNDMGPPMRVMLFASDGCSPGVRPTPAATKAVVKLLLERGADIHAADKNGNSAITEAAMKGCDRELIRMLLKAGAKVNAPHSSGLTPFEMGLWSGHDGLEEFIAAGYRLPPEKARAYLEAYKDQPAAVTMVKKGSAKK